MDNKYTSWLISLRQKAIRLIVVPLLITWSCLLPPFIGEAIAAPTTPVSVTITRVTCRDDCRNTGLEAAGQSAADFYAVIDINGVVIQTPRGDEDSGEITPNWKVTADIPNTQSSFPVSIQIWDHDSTSGDDLGDASPVVDKNNLDFTVNRLTGEWSGDLKSSENCAHGGNPGGEPAVEVCFEVGGYEDTDGDGLLDNWEKNGLDTDSDGTIDVNLPGMGANSRHKDIFLELDWMTGQQPTREAIQALKAAFAAAPIDAGRIKNPANPLLLHILNPDGQPGINLWVDTGSLTDATGNLVGDNLGGGNSLPTSNISALTSNFYAVRNNPSNFDPRRSLVFHYALSAAQPSNNTGTSTGTGNTTTTLNDTSQTWILGEWEKRTVTITGGTGAGQTRTIMSNAVNQLVINHDEPWITIPDNTSTYNISLTGGDGEVGGNDFIEYNHDPGSIMHELGHNLNLKHGGFVGINCKPNYVSVMNYDNQSGIRQTAGSPQGQDFDRNGSLEIIDYSPPRFPGGRGKAPLPVLVEDSLNEATILDSTDAANQFVYTRRTGVKLPHPLNQRIDWNGDGDTDDSGGLPFNLNGVGIGGLPRACATNTSSDETLSGYDDWSNIVLNFRQFGDSRKGPINPVNELEPTLEDYRLLNEELNRTSWRVLNSPLLPFAKVAFADANSGIVVSGNGTIVTTTNGGTDWLERTSGTNVALRGVAVFGLERAWAVGDNGTIIATTDGGVTFTTQDSNTSQMLSGVSFVSPEKGWVVGAGTILSTDDGGVTWVKDPNNDTPASKELLDVFFLNEKNGWAVGSGGIIQQTTDGGNTWMVKESGTTSQLFGVSFPAPRIGYAVGRDNTIVATKDGGETWIPQPSNADPTTIFLGVSFIDGNTGWVVGSNATILATNDGGNNYKVQDFPGRNPAIQNLSGVSFPDPSNGYIVSPNSILKFSFH